MLKKVYQQLYYILYTFLGSARCTKAWCCDTNGASSCTSKSTKWPHKTCQ